MSSKGEAAGGGSKGGSFLKPGKADGHHKKQQEREGKKRFSPAKSRFSGLMEDLKGQI